VEAGAEDGGGVGGGGTDDGIDNASTNNDDDRRGGGIRCSSSSSMTTDDDDDENNNNNNNNHRADRDSWAPGLEMGHPDEPADFTTNLDRGSAHSTASSAADIVTNARLIQQQNHVARKVGKKVPPPRSTMEHMLTM